MAVIYNVADFPPYSIDLSLGLSPQPKQQSRILPDLTVSDPVKESKMKSSLKTLLAGTGLASLASAVTPVSDSDMTNLLNAGGVELAMKAQPMWFFGQAMNQPPCIPTFATTNGGQTPSAALCAYPNMGCNCRTPGVPITNVAPSFPTYYSYQKCTDTTIRIQYSLFYEKDG